MERIQKPVRYFFVMTLILGLCRLASAREPDLVKHYDEDYSDNVRRYLTEVLHLVLEKSRAEYGDYRLTFHSKSLSPARSKKEAELGDKINTLFAPDWKGHFLDETKVIRLDYPVFNGLLGMRCLIGTRETIGALESVSSMDQFRSYRAGQGSNWGEVDIFRSNGLQLVEGHSYETLFPMLRKNRFDYLPLSVLEAPDALSVQASSDDLILTDNVTLFYPVDFGLYVNAEQPELAKRLARGLTIATEDGSLQTLFSRAFPGVEERILERQRRVILLKNVLISDQRNVELTGKFLERYGARLTVLP